MSQPNEGHLTYHPDFSEVRERLGYPHHQADSPDHHSRADEDGHHRSHNVGEAERLVSSAVGAGLVAIGLMRKSLGGLALAAVGGSLLHRGVTGRCQLYKALNFSTAVPEERKVQHALHDGMQVEDSVVVSRPVSEVYAFWRNLSNLPQFFDHLDSVEVIDETRSRWRVHTDRGIPINWEAEIINEEEDALIAWRSLEDSQIYNAGVVRFQARGDRETEVHVRIRFALPGGRAAVRLAKLVGEDPQRELTEDLQNLKRVMEVGA